MHINKSQIYHTNLFSFLVGFYPLAYILGNSIINVLTTLITILGLGLYRKKIFFCNNKIYTLLLLSFFFYLACTSIINNYPKLAELPNYLINIKKSLFYFRYFFFFLVINYLCNKKLINFKFLYYFSSFLVLFLSLDILIQLTFGKDLFGIKPIPRHYTGFFGDELVAGSYLQKFSFFLIFLIFVFKSQINKNKKIIMLTLFLILTFSAIILAGNRMPAFIYVMSLITVSFLIKKFRKGSLILILIFSSTFFAIFNLNDGTKNDFKVFYNHSKEIVTMFPKIISDTGNLGLINSNHLQTFHAAVITWENKIIGGGIRSLRTNCPEDFNRIKNPYNDRRCNWHPHNFHLEILIDMGLIGLFLFIPIFYYPIILFLKRFIFESSNASNLYLVVPFFIVLSSEIFPLRTTGSFFTTSNATLIYLMLAIVLNFKTFEKEINLNNNTY
mgnify:CR=1 FL=1